MHFAEALGLGDGLIEGSVLERNAAIFDPAGRIAAAEYEKTFSDGLGITRARKPWPSLFLGWSYSRCV